MTCHCDNRAEFWRSVGGLISFCSYFCGSGQMLSLEDGTSSGSGHEVEGTKREGPSEYEISLENKNKQVWLLLFKVRVESVGSVSTWWEGVNADSFTCFSVRRCVDDHLTMCHAWQKRLPFRSISIRVDMKKNTSDVAATETGKRKMLGCHGNS